MKINVKSYFVLIILCIYSILGSRLIHIDNDYQEDFINEFPYWLTILLFIITGVIETIFFNFIPQYFLNKFFNNKLIIILISSIIFGLLHFSSIEFILITFFAGILLNYNFTLYYPKYKIAIIITALVHIISNFIVYNFDSFSNGSFS